MHQILVGFLMILNIQKGVFVAWARNCSGSESGYVKFLAELRSGRCGSGIEWVSLDPEAERWQDYGNPDPLPGGIMETRRGALNVGVSESVGGLDAPPGMRSVKVAAKRSRKFPSRR